MTRPERVRPMGPALRGYLLAARAVPLVAPALLRRRLARGKELPDRWREKLGEASRPRPDGRLVWLHAVGLGEVLALRGLIAAMAQLSDVSFLVTSTTRGSAEVLAANLPPRSVHQFLPLDAPGYLDRFLDHWRPDLSIWSEQDLWPGAVVAADRRGIPLALVNTAPLSVIADGGVPVTVYLRTVVAPSFANGDGTVLQRGCDEVAPQHRR